MREVNQLVIPRNPISSDTCFMFSILRNVEHYTETGLSTNRKVWTHPQQSIVQESLSTDNCNWFNLLLLRNNEQHTAYIIIIHCIEKSCKTTYKYHILISNKKFVVSKNKNLMKYCSHTLTYRFQLCNYFVSTNLFQILILQGTGIIFIKAMVYKILYKDVNTYDHLCQIRPTSQPGIWYLKHYYNGN
jgi:hypothetical protein